MSGQRASGVRSMEPEGVQSTGGGSDAVGHRGSRLALALFVLALIGLVITAYLLAVRLAGELPACPVTGGCETVQQSKYSAIAGIPVAAMGLVYSIVLVVATAVWWRLADRRALYIAYGLGLIGTLMAAYLTYLELFVIHAICIWCVGYAVTVVSGWVGAIVAVRLAGSE
jgi:uncharacterized membrane protein